MHQPNGSNMHC